MKILSLLYFHNTPVFCIKFLARNHILSGRSCHFASNPNPKQFIVLELANSVSIFSVRWKIPVPRNKMFAVPTEKSNLKNLFSIVRLVTTWQCLWIYPLNLNIFIFLWKVEMITSLWVYEAGKWRLHLVIERIKAGIMVIVNDFLRSCHDLFKFTFGKT